MLFRSVIDTGDMETFPGYLKVQVNIDTEVGRDYYFLLQGVESAFRVAYADNTGDNINIYIGALYYGDVEDTEQCMVADYVYEVPLRKGKTLVLFASFLLAGVLVSCLTALYYKRYPERNTLLTVERAMRFVLNPVIVAAAVAAAVAIGPCRL